MIGQAIVAAGIVAALSAGIVLKAERYLSGPVAVNGAGDAGPAVISLLARHGWSPVADPMVDQMPYVAAAFARPGCPGRIVVTVLGSQNGIEPLVRSLNGSDLAFVQNGQVRHEASVIRHQLGQAMGAVRQAIGLGSGGGFPILAVSPAPIPGSRDICRGPAAEAWQGLGR